MYFAREMLANAGETVEGKTAVISGSGNVALYAAEKLIEMGATVVALSDRGGFIHEPDGLNTEQLAYIIDLKENRRGRLAEYAKEYGSTFCPGFFHLYPPPFVWALQRSGRVWRHCARLVRGDESYVDVVRSGGPLAHLVRPLERLARAITARRYGRPRA